MSDPSCESASPGDGARWAHRPHLDGLRAVAATLVVLFHADAPQWSGGFIGVDVFFVLSGFLITGVWLAGRRDPVSFYARRIRRLLPASLITLLGTAVVWRLLASPMEARSRADDVWGAALYASNWVFALDAQDYFQHDQPPSPFLHFWSLAVEEQFYLVWPWLLAGVVALTARRSWLWVTGLACGGIGVAVWTAQIDPVLSHFGTHVRAWQLLAGAVLAFSLARFPRRWSGGGVLAATGLAISLLAGTSLLPLSPPPRGAVSVLGVVLLIVGGELAPGSRFLQPLRWNWIQRLGGASYSAYLVHWPFVLMADRYQVLPADGVIRVTLVLMGSWALALLLHHTVERPTMSVSLHTVRRRWSAIGGGLVASGLAAVLGHGILMSGSSGPLDLAAHFEEAEPKGVLVHGPDGGGPRVLLAGDSHAEHWWPAVSELGSRHGWDVDLYWVAACGWAEQQDERCRHRTRAECGTRLRTALAEEVARTPTALVILGSYMDGTCTVSGVPPDAPDYTDVLAAAADITLTRLEGSGAQVLMLEPIPALAVAPLSCVDASMDASRCPGDPIEDVGPTAAERAWRKVASGRDGVGTVDLDRVACPDGRCPTVVDGMLTRRDVHHLQASFVRTGVDAVEAAFVLAGLDLETATLHEGEGSP